MPVEQLQNYVGTYEIDKDFKLIIKLKNDQLFAEATGQNALPIFAESETLFFLKVVDAQLEFEKNDKNEIVKLFLLQNGNRIEAKRTE
ncbi:MAG: hypothetical protein Fur0028_08960 [Bacteroidales bacterium]|uniref:Peptidase S12 Pab87-related C-terminal domain-containing protein n=1 Tax=Thermoflexibacter ruber TaxID=1003 RepID=A0A1I2HEB7_9BACT|nr:protein of unknown function [Thermoflexibacter ruber]